MELIMQVSYFLSEILTICNRYLTVLREEFQKKSQNTLTVVKLTREAENNFSFV